MSAAWRALRNGVYFLGLTLGVPTPALGFPPYRSTDADTAARGVLEARLGLLRALREDGEYEYTSPLLRLNLGLSPNTELISELEYQPEEDRISDGAAGLKFVSRGEDLNVGIETLVLLPVSPGQSGVGVESQFLATFERDRYLLHLNAGGFYDPRSGASEHGWRASLLGEQRRAKARVGLEIFARRSDGESVQVQAGAGLIAPAGRLTIRAGIHAGLTAAAPDLVASIWISTEARLWQ